MRVLQTGRVTSARQQLHLAATAGEQSAQHILRIVNECPHDVLEAGIPPLAEDRELEDPRQEEDPIFVLQQWMAAARGMRFASIELGSQALETATRMYNHCKALATATEAHSSSTAPVAAIPMKSLG